MHADPYIRLFSQNPLLQLASALAFGIVFATFFEIRITYLFVGLILVTLATLVSAYSARISIAGFTVLTALFFAGSILTSLQMRKAPNQLKSIIEQRLIRPSESVELIGVVTGPVELARDGIHFSLNVEKVNTVTLNLKSSGVVALTGYLRHSYDAEKYRNLRLQSGSRISVRTRIDRTEQYRNPGVSSLAEYLDTKDIDAIALVRGPESIGRLDSASSIAAFVYQWRDFLQREIDTRFSTETAAVLAAALLGNRYNLSNITAERFREGGTFHILVISGAHISFLGALILLFARRLDDATLVATSGISICRLALHPRGRC